MSNDMAFASGYPLRITMAMMKHVTFERHWEEQGHRFKKAQIEKKGKKMKFFE